MSIRLLRAPLFVVIALLVGGATAFGMPYIAHTAPSVTITSKPAAWANSASPTFKWSKSGTISSTTCQIDGGSFTACTTSKTYSGLTAGAHTFTVKVSGSSGSASKSYGWSIDLTDPVGPTAVTGGSLSWRNTTASLVPSGGSDGESGLKSYQYRKSTDGGSTWGTITSGNSASVSGAGTTITQFRAIDKAGNTSAWFPTVADATNTVKIDKTLPTAPTVTGGGAATEWQNIASFTLDASGSTDAGGSGFNKYQVRYSSNGGTTYGAASDGATQTISTEGNNWVQFRGVDNAGNASAWVTGYARIDRSVPTAPNIVGGGSLWKAGTSVSVTASGSTDAGSGISGYEYQTSPDGATWSATTAGSRAAVTTEGHTYVRFRAVDKAGYVSDWTQTDVWYDGSDPSLPTVSGGSTSWTNGSSVTVSASGATDAVSGVFNYQYRKSTDGGNTWSLPVNGSSLTISTAGETLVQFRSTDNAGRHSAYAPATPNAGSTVRIDRIAPSSPSVTNDSQTWKDVASVTVTASGSTDSGGAGVNHYERQTSTDNGSTWSVLTSGSSIAVTAEGQTLVRFQSVDGAGNRSGLVQATVRIDRSNPTAPTVAGGSLSWVLPGSYPITGSGSTDSPGSGVSGYQYRTSADGGSTWSAATDGSAATISAEGTTVVQFRAKDGIGHVSAWVPASPGASSTVKIDGTAPTVPSVTGGSGSWTTVTPQSVSASGSTDAGSGGVTYSYQTSPDNSTWSASTAGSSVSVSAQGTTYVRFAAADALGNTAYSTSVTVKIDTVAPSVPSLTGGGASWFTTSPQSVTASGSTDAGSGGVTYRYQTSPDNATWSGATAGSPISVSAQGTTYVRFAAVDAVGNASAYGTGVAVKIDTVAPSVPSLTGGGASWFTTSPQSVTASGSTDATSGGVTYRYQTSPDNSTWSGFTSGSSISVATQGITYVRFAAVDAAGNVSAYTTGVAVKIDTVAPTAPTVSGGSSTCSGTARTISATGSTDATSGFLRYEYRISTNAGSTWGATTTGSTLTFSTSGVTSYIQYRSVDNAGNVSAWAPAAIGASNEACIT
jgi:hypothetical protein